MSMFFMGISSCLLVSLLTNDDRKETVTFKKKTLVTIAGICFIIGLLISVFCE